MHKRRFFLALAALVVVFPIMFLVLLENVDPYGSWYFIPLSCFVAVFIAWLIGRIMSPNRDKRKAKQKRQPID